MLQYGVKVGTTVNNTFATSISEGNEMFVITTLSPETSYFFQVFAINSNGVQGPRSIIEVRTARGE